MTSPDPVPVPVEPLAAIVTTEGTTWPATEVTGQALTVAEVAEVSGLTAEPRERQNKPAASPGIDGTPAGRAGWAGLEVIVMAAGVVPFRIAVPEAELADLRRRLADTRWPEPETVDGRSSRVRAVVSAAA